MVNKLRILVLDDEPIVGNRLRPALAKSGYEVTAVTTGAEALRLIDESHFDIVVTDIRMEGIDGLDVLRHVRARSPRTLVIMITGFATVEVAREALTMGAFDFIAKPFKLRTGRDRVAHPRRARRRKRRAVSRLGTEAKVGGADVRVAEAQAWHKQRRHACVPPQVRQLSPSARAQ